LLSIALQAQDTVQYRIQFACNSASIDYLTTEEIDFLSDVTILSIEGYASVEGSSAANLQLSQDRAEAVRSILQAEVGTAYGATEAFGKSRGANRVVIVTYVTKTKTTSTINAEGIVVETPTPSDIEGFTCGERVDPSVYFADTLVETVDTITTIQAPIVLENVSPKLTHDSTSYVVKPIAVDTTFLPIRQAVKFQMRENGMSRSEAIKSIEARKPQWKQLKPSKPKAKKVKMKRTRGVNNTLFTKIFPFAGC
jgi:hypothetical protein